MYIKKIVLQNIGPYEFFKRELDPGLIGVVGSNGSGKTTLLNAAYACLTNDWSRLNQRKEGVIRDTSDVDDAAYVMVEGVHGDVEFTLTRYLRPNKHELYIGDEKFTKATEIQDQLDNILGLKRQLIDNYIFVDQGEIFSFLSATDAERAKAFQLLCNTGKAEEIWKLAGELSGELGEVAHLDLDDNRDHLRDSVAKNQAKIDKTEREKKKKKSSLLTKKKKQEYEKVIKAKTEYDVLSEQFAELEPKVAKAAKEHRQAEKKLKNASLMLDDGRVCSDRAKVNAEAAREALKKKEEIEKKQERLASKRSMLEALPKPLPPEVPKGWSKKAHKELNDRSVELDQKLTEYRVTLGQFEEEGVVECPTCGTLVTDMEDHLKAMADFVKDNDDLSRTNNETLLDWDDYVEDEKIYDNELKDYKKDKKRYETDIAELEEEMEVVPEGDPEDWAEAIRVETQAKTAYQNTKKHYDVCNAKEIETSTRHTQLAEQLIECQNKLEGLETDEEAFEEAERLISAHNAVQGELKALDSTIDSYQSALDDFQKELDRKERLIARAGRARDFMERLTRIREVCHRDYWPRMVAQNYLEDIQDDMNEWLDKFGPPFRVRVEDGLNFEYKQPGDPWRQASQLSGGQKVVMALAFRRAVNLLFASEVGMMTLDEPTEKLDEHNLSCLREALFDLAADTQKSGNQIIVITHHKILHPAFNQLIEVVR